MKFLRLPTRFMSLRYTLALALVLGLVGPSWVALEHEKQEVQLRLMEELKADLERYADLLVQALREPVWHLSPEFGAPIVDTVMRDPRVARVRVTLAPQDGVFIERIHAESNAPPIFSAMRSIAAQGRDVARIELDMSAASIYRQVSEAEHRFYWRTGSSLLGALALIFLAFYLRFMRPVERLASQSAELASNHWGAPFVWDRVDEIGRVGRCLEDTRQSLARMFSEVQKINADLVQENQDRRKAEEALAKYAAELEDRVSERTQDLSASNEELTAALRHLTLTQRELVESEKLASLGRLVAGVAHELNTPIGNAVMVGSTLGDHVRDIKAQMESGQLKKSSLMRFMEETMGACVLLGRSLEQAAQLVANFKQVAVDQTSAQRREFDVETTLKEVLSTLRPRLKKTPFVLELKAATGLRMDSYPGQLGQVITNLVINAELHAYAGRMEGTISVEAEESGEHVRIVVRDNGCGIAEKIRGKIFDPFFTTKMGSGGTGLGLNIVHSLVTRVLGGRLTLESVEGAGSAFIMDLPKIAPLVVGEEDAFEAAG